MNPIRPTTLIEANALAMRLGLKKLTIASETFQVTGSFKFRAAYNLVSKVEQSLIIGASSGNFGQAIACACELLGKQAIIVMPDRSARVKVDAVRSYGARAELINTDIVGREERVAQLAEEYPGAYVASAYDDQLVIEGNATLGIELADRLPGTEYVIAPVGGGGLTSGLISGLCTIGSAAKVVGAEPLEANDAAQSLLRGEIVRNESESRTIADGARTRSLGQLNWSIIQHGIDRILEAPEALIEQSVRELYNINLKAEPTGALSLAAVFSAPDIFRDKTVCCVVSGGNVDPAVYARIIQGG